MIAGEQQKEVVHVIIGRGKHQFRQQYQFLEIQEKKLYTINQEQQRKHTERVSPLHSINTQSDIVSPLVHYREVYTVPYIIQK